MAIKLADLSFIRRSTAEVSVLRELISFKQSKRTGPEGVYLALMCQLKEEQFRIVMNKLAKAGFISYERVQSLFQGHVMTHYGYVLHLDKIQQLVTEGEKFVFKTVLERSSNSQRGTEATSVGKSTSEKEGETKEANTPVAEALATNPKAIPDPFIISSRYAPEVLDGLSLFRKQAEYKDLGDNEA